LATKKPVETIRHVDESASIWRNVSEEGKAFYNVTFQKRYSQDGETKYGSSLNAYDLDDLVRCTVDRGCRGGLDPCDLVASVSTGAVPTDG
jgi:hypothetical protein